MSDYDSSLFRQASKFYEPCEANIDDVNCQECLHKCDDYWKLKGYEEE